MRPKTKVRAAQFLIPVLLIIAVAGAVTGQWFVVAGMLLAVLVQLANYRVNRGRLG